jgi:streptogramin lyase
MPEFRPRLLLLLIASLLIASAGCGGGGRGGGGGSGLGGTGLTGMGGMGGGASCPASSATGTLSIRFSGTPLGDGLVTLPPDTSEITIDSDVTLPAGSHDVWAYIVAVDGTPFRTAYQPTLPTQTACVRAGQQTMVNVAYTLVPTSGLLWLGASNNPTSDTLFGYEGADLASTGSALALALANTYGSDGFTFDMWGNLWVLGGTTADPPVARYPASQFATDGPKTPDLVIDSFSGALPGPKVLAFDAFGSLWVSVVADNKVVKFTEADLSTANPTASVEMGGIPGPAGIAFDAAGNLWVASSATIMRIDASHHGTSGTGADLTLTSLSEPPVIGELTDPLGIAFDGAGNLWVNYNQGIIARLTPADLSGTGTKTVTPAVQVELDIQALAYGMAFDETGGLWLAYTGGRFARLAASQLTVSGVITPQTVITSSDIGSAAWFAIYPAPAFTPLAHALP